MALWTPCGCLLRGLKNFVANVISEPHAVILFTCCLTLKTPDTILLLPSTQLGLLLGYLESVMGYFIWYNKAVISMILRNMVSYRTLDVAGQ